MTEAVTWDVSYLQEKNLSVIIQGDYVNATGGGQQAFHSSFLQNSLGFYAWMIDEAWLQGKSSSNITLYLFPVNPSAEEPTRIVGPTIMVTTRPRVRYHQPPTKMPTNRDLFIALPCVLAFVLVCVCGVAFWNRKKRVIGLGNIMGRRRGYDTGKSRAQRLGERQRKKDDPAAVQLRTQELTADGQYRDAPENKSAAD
jgi:hypothetical protein